jgi:hypothetical protein
MINNGNFIKDMKLRSGKDTSCIHHHVTINKKINNISFYPIYIINTGNSEINVVELKEINLYKDQK